MALGLIFTVGKLKSSSAGSGSVVSESLRHASTPHSPLHFALLFNGQDTTLPPPPHHLPPQPSFQRIVGRLSAWACTTLYLSSRLPQIWKNVSY